jgi:hypothetical protein
VGADHVRWDRHLSVLGVYSLCKGHRDFPDPPPYPYLHIRNKDFPWGKLRIYSRPRENTILNLNQVSKPQIYSRPKNNTIINLNQVSKPQIYSRPKNNTILNLNQVSKALTNSCLKKYSYGFKPNKMFLSFTKFIENPYRFKTYFMVNLMVFILEL